MTRDQAVELLRHSDLHELGRLADAEVHRRFPDNIRTYIIDRNINYTNICQTECQFCNFSRRLNDPSGTVISEIELLEKIKELYALGGRQILLQGGHNPNLSFEWYTNLLKTIKSHFSDAHIHGFSPPEIIFFSNQFGKSVEWTLNSLQGEGLDTIPGGGAEILVDRVRKLISPKKCSADDWLNVMKTAHKLGIRTTATMMFGHIETLEERIEHLDKLRTLQDETKGFTAFIGWTFQHKGTMLEKNFTKEFHPASVQDYLRTLAVSRLFLDNFENLQASWVTQGLSVGQIALKFGANDFGSLMIEENVVASTGTQFHTTESELRDYIHRAGFVPSRRDCYYNRLGM
jgi:cyclic dehypoxanthinyl futalosine synthase